METKHGVEIISYKEIWEMIKDFHDYIVEKQKKKNKIFKVKRQIFLNKWKIQFKEVRMKIDDIFKGVFYKSVAKREAEEGEK